MLGFINVVTPFATIVVINGQKFQFIAQPVEVHNLLLCYNNNNLYFLIRRRCPYLYLTLYDCSH